MTINMPLLEECIYIYENKSTVLIVEDPQIYYKIINEWKDNIDGIDESIAIFENHKEMLVKKQVELLTDLFNFTVNNRKNITKLHTRIKEISYREDFYCKSQTLLSNQQKYLADIIFELESDVKFDEEIDISGIFKVFDVKYEEENNSLLEKLINFIKVISEFSLIKLLVIVNLKAVLSEVELCQLYKESNYMKMNLLLIENNYQKTLDGEKVYILDKDRCLVYK